MNTWYVMSGGTSRARAFSANAVNLTEAEAEAEAKRRNAVERAAGRNKDAVLWFAMDGAPLMAMRAKLGLD